MRRSDVGVRVGGQVRRGPAPLGWPPTAKSLLRRTTQVRGREVATIESVAPEEVAALNRSGGTQCGACSPGVVMTARYLVAHPELLEEFRAAELMAGNLCRCTGYAGILEGIEEMARCRS